MRQRPAAGPRPAHCGSLLWELDRHAAGQCHDKLALGSDGKFTWTLNHSGNPQQFSGTYSLADNLLVLKQGDNPVMVGQVVLRRRPLQLQAGGRQPQRPRPDLRAIAGNRLEIISKAVGWAE